MSRIIGFILALPLFAVALLFGASEFGGEVVVLETTGGRGEKFTTSLWVADIEGISMLRSGDPNSEWLTRLQVEPKVTVVRDDARMAYRAEVVPNYSEKVNHAMREKYGIADQIVGVLHDEDSVVAVRLLEH